MKKFPIIAACSLAAALVLMPEGASAQVADTAKKDTSAVRRPVTPPSDQNRAAANQVRPVGAISDSAIIAMLQLSHTQQIASAELALQRGQSDQVKKFAEELKTEHSNALQELQTFAEKMKNDGNRGMPSGMARDTARVGVSAGMGRDSARLGRDNNVTGRRDSAMARPDTTAKMQDSARVGRDANAAVGRPDSAVKVDTSMAKMDHRDTSKVAGRPGAQPDVTLENIGALSGHEFDHGFIRLQIQHHETEISRLRNDVIPMIKDSDLKALVQRDLPKLGRHLTQAREIEAHLKTSK
jgi:predicted outer membrane protein